MSLRNNIILGVLASMVIFGSIVVAQDPDGDLLAGPSVQDEEVTQEDMRAEHTRTTGKAKQNRKNKEQLRMWITTLRSLDLTEDQQKEVHSIVQKLRKDQEAFQKKHGKEMRELREKSKEAMDNGNDIPDDVGTRTRELLALSPKPEEYQSKAWTLLNEVQQKDFQKKYEAAIEAMNKRRKDRIGKGDSMIDDPMMDDLDQRRDHRQRDLDSDDRQIRVKQNHQRGDRQNVGDSTDQAAMRRINFLRRLQRLQDQNQ